MTSSQTGPRRLSRPTLAVVAAAAVLMPPSGAVALTAAETGGMDAAYIVQSSFDERPTGPFVHGTDGWNVDVSAGNAVEVVSVPSAEDHSLRISRAAGTGSGGSALAREFEAPLTGTVGVSARVMRSDSEAGFFGLPYVYDEAGQPAVSVALARGDIVAYEGTTLRTIGQYEPGRWYDIDLTVDTDAQTFDLAIDGEAVFTDATPRTPLTGISRIAWYANGGERGSVHVDDIAIYRPGLLVDESFDALPTGALADGTNGWGVVATGNAVDVVAVPSESDKSVRLTRTTTNGGTAGTSLSRTFDAPVQGLVTIEAEVMRDDDQAGWFGLPYVYNASGQPAVSVAFARGDIVAYEGSTSRTVGTYERGRWYQVAVTIDTVNQRFDLEVDGEPLLTGATFRNELPGIARVAWYANGGERGAVYVDDVRIARGVQGEASEVVHIDEAFDAQTEPPNFGFPQGARVADGVLRVTEDMDHYTTSVSRFDAAVRDQRTLDLSFDWKTDIASTGMKTGLELRGADDNLVFALAATGAEMRYGVTGPASDSSAAPDSLNPAWTKIAFDRTKWYTVDLHMDFTVGTVQYTIATREASPRVMASGTGKIAATNLDRLVACNYYGVGPQSVDNVLLRRPAHVADGILQGKRVYAFGDSIVAGHKYSRGFVDLVAEREGITVSKHARNGATVMNAGFPAGTVIQQVRAASATSPDLVVFDGGTNDIEAITTAGHKVGTVSSGFDPAGFDSGTYAGALEATVHEMRSKWPNAPIVYVAVHKLGSRDWDTQLAVREVTLQVAEKWGLTYADVFAGSTLDTRDDVHRAAYTFDDLLGGFPGTNGSGTHPNIEGMTRFFVPVLTEALVDVVRSDAGGGD
ncbi:GDSL-type esterase/lipase family protein [Isoptericola croceus]|uniref:GDSL-type esterase/lipase family protein n=1 Tax=Isoptericola croceus TaxID=3031406 RepID=UPI0023F81438|nr:GDSL-type esterase/lipase family protein [Isoptericola croceus]